jgi:threonine dehydratase
MAAGHPVSLPGTATMADGIAVSRPGEVPFELISALAPDVRTVSEEQLSRALLLCLERAKLVVEPAGAAAVAALLDDPQAFAPPVVAVLSGGNVDPLLMLRVLRHGLSAAGRYVAFRLRVPDRPGALAAMLGELAAADANVLEVEHLRTNPRLHVDEAEVNVQIETRGGSHTDAVLARMRAAGYTLTFG